MIVTTNAIVLSALKYGDTGLIVKCFTEREGVKSYLLKGVRSSKSKKLKPAYFQPTTQLNIVANHNSKGNLNSIRDVHLAHPYNSIFSDIYKQSIVFFLAEVLSFSIREEEENELLYKYLELSFLWLDSAKKYSNFHLLFLLDLTKYLGFYPEQNNQNYNFFDLLEGEFINSLPKANYISGNVLDDFKSLLGINFDALENIEFNSKRRGGILDVLIQYYELHLTGFRKLKSLEVLKNIFN